MRETTKRTLLFRQNINRTNAEWARFLENYREDLIRWLMKEYGVDWHTAEDIVSEVFLEIIRNSHILNLRPDDSFRHTLIVLCKHKYTQVAQPWRRKLLNRLCDALQLSRLMKNSETEELALGFIDLVVKDLEDETKDGARPYTSYSPTDLDRWRAQHRADPSASTRDLAREAGVSDSTFRKSCRKVEDAIVDTVKQIMGRR